MAAQPLYRTVQQMAIVKRQHLNDYLKALADIDLANVANITLRSSMVQQDMIKVWILEKVVSFMQDPHQKKTSSEVRSMFETASESVAHDEPYLGANVIKARTSLLFEIFGTSY